MSIEAEKLTIEQMIRLFCDAKHGAKDSLCDECSALVDYAHARLEHCRFGDDKPICRKCTVHCYKPEMRERINEVMRFAGPRMLAKHPASAVRHLLRAFRTP